VKVTFEDETTGDKDGLPARRGLVDYLKKIVAERGAKPVHEAPFVVAEGERREARARPAVDRVHRRTPAQLRQRHPDRLGRHTRERLPRGVGKAVRNYIETHNLSPKGVTLTAEDIREGMTGMLSVFIRSRSSRARPRIG
jgi:DNA gyrase/topoisomerase IV subunit B